MENPEKPREPSVWKPLWINLIILAAYCVLLPALEFLGGGAGKMQESIIFLAFLIALQVLINLLLFIAHLFVRVDKAGVYLLSALMILIVGFSACSGIVGLTQKIAAPAHRTM